MRVIDLATVIAGPGAARYLADFGADVIKVERPGGDATRSMGWIAPGDQDSLFWKLVNRGKRSIVLDLKDPQGIADMWELIASADVLVENMRPGKLEALGLTPEALLTRNPRLVILRVSGFGQSGPYAQRPGFATIAEAMSGFSDLSGEPEGGPLLPPVALTDEVTALVGAFSTMVAVFHAAKTGQGQVVDVSLLDSLFQIMGPLPSAWDQLGYLQPRMGSSIPYTVPRGTYQCADGVWVAVSASAESVAGRLLELLAVADDERFADFRGRFENREALEAVTRKWISERSSDEVLAAFEAVDAAIAKVNTLEDVMVDPHVIERGSFTRVDGVMMQNVAARMSLTPGSITSSGPALGADTESILTEIRKD
jgi:crotonobetainyl-CoA:carnitine CoA-transferase CaiB-like acyl-CoA transferase